MTLLGTIFGVWLNLIFPAIVLIVLLAIVLAITAWRTFGRAFELYRKENMARNGINAIPMLPEVNSENVRLRAPIDTESDELKQLLNAESKLPWKYLFSLFAIWIVLSGKQTHIFSKIQIFLFFLKKN